MKFCPYPRLIMVLLFSSVALNAWQFFREVPPETPVAPRRSVWASASRPSLAGAQLPAAAAEEEAADEEGDEGDENKLTPWSEIPPESQTEEELIYGALPRDAMRQIRVPAERVSLQRLRELETMPASQRFTLHGRLLLPGNRVLDMGEFEVKPGQKMRFERIKEFPYPNSFDLAQPQDSGSPAISPVTPTTPSSFDIQNTGLTAEIEATAGYGYIMLAGRVTQRVFEGFSRMPGEAFLPIIDTAGTLLTDNKVLMPQFTTREAPFVAAATAGKPCLVPVLTAFGQTSLELTCTPLE